MAEAAPSPSIAAGGAMIDRGCTRSLVIGTSGSGKSRLLQGEAIQWARKGIPVLLLDPLDNPQWNNIAHRRTANAAVMLKWAQATHNCRIIIDEASIALDRDRQFNWFFTISRNRGHSVSIICQTATQVLPAIREQATELIVFFAADSNAAELGDTFPACRQLQFSALKPGEFFRIKPQHAEKWKICLDTRRAQRIK